MEKTKKNQFSYILSKGEEKSEQSKEYKEYRRRWRENPDNDIVEDFPIHLDLELNTMCNLKCKMCFHSFDPPKPTEMDFFLFKKAVDEGAAKGACSVKLQFRGEPLVSKNLAKAIRYAKNKGILETIINTNGTLLTQEKSVELIEAGLDKIIFSIDGCTKEVYEKIRLGGNFETVVDNIKKMQELKRAAGKNKPVIQIQMCLTKLNKHQAKDFTKFGKSIGVENCSVTEEQDWGMTKEDTTVLNDFACEQLWQRLFVLANGDIMPCCQSVKEGKHEIETLGNLRDITLEEIWKGKRMNELRELHRTGCSHKVKMCRFCGVRHLYSIKEMKNE
jgi:radical SAM protein with 4Fe4S-binding SPASM domain